MATDPWTDEVIDTLKRLAALSRLDPRSVCDILRRRPRWVRGTEYWDTYLLCGGSGMPIAHSNLMWSRRRSKGSVGADLSPGLGVPVWAVADAVVPGLKPIPVGPDPENPNPEQCFAYPVPAGELRLVFPGFGDRAVLERFVLSEVPLVIRKREGTPP